MKYFNNLKYKCDKIKSFNYNDSLNNKYTNE